MFLNAIACFIFCSDAVCIEMHKGQWKIFHGYTLPLMTYSINPPSPGYGGQEKSPDSFAGAVII